MTEKAVVGVNDLYDGHRAKQEKYYLGGARLKIQKGVR